MRRCNPTAVRALLCLLLCLWLCLPCPAMSEDGAHITRTLPSGAQIDADLVGLFPRALPAYRVRNRHIPLEQVADAYMRRHEPLRMDTETNRFAETEICVSTADTPDSMGGRIIYASLVYQRQGAGLIYDVFKYYLQDMAACLQRECDFLPRADALRQMEEAFAAFVDNMQLEPLELLALRHDDLADMQRLLYDNPEHRRVLTEMGYRWQDPLPADCQYYRGHFRLCLNGIPLLSQSDTYGYPARPANDPNYAPSDFWMALSPAGCEYLSIECAMEFVEESAPQTLLTLEEALAAYDAFADNGGDFRYPGPIRRIFLQYIPVNIRRDGAMVHDLRPYWCLTEEAVQATGDTPLSLSDSAYRFDAITGEFLVTRGPADD